MLGICERGIDVNLDHRGRVELGREAERQRILRGCRDHCSQRIWPWTSGREAPRRPEGASSAWWRKS